MTIDLDALATALATAFPDLVPLRPLRFLGASVDTAVCETPAEVMVRVGLTPRATLQYDLQARLLPTLHGCVPVAVPQPRWFVAVAAGLPHGALAYHKLAGVPLTPARLMDLDRGRLAHDLAAFLLTLHRLPHAQVDTLGLPRAAGWGEGDAAALDITSPLLRSVLTSQECASLSRWWAGVCRDERLRAYAPVLCHGDLWYENLLLDAAGQRLAAVLDWEEAAIGDPARDLAALGHLGEDVGARVLAAYHRGGGRHDENLAYRVERWWDYDIVVRLLRALAEGAHARAKGLLATLHARPGTLLTAGQ